jgi:hypothetical protein
LFLCLLFVSVSPSDGRREELSNSHANAAKRPKSERIPVNDGAHLIEKAITAYESAIIRVAPPRFGTPLKPG